jgi:CRP-like cAMP-binding protein
MAQLATESQSWVHLLDVEPDLGRFLTTGEREEVRRVTVSARSVRRGELALDRLLHDAGAFGAIVVEGLLMHRLSLGAQPALQLLGRGDILSRSSEGQSELVSRSTFRAASDMRLAMLDDRVLLIAHHFPRLFSGLHVRMGAQHQRLAAQLVICQLPRVEQRILSIMRLLAETWGRVTPSGTVLPVALTHDALGELVGARRPTVTIALKDLAGQGVLFRQDGGWILLEPHPSPSEPPPAPLGENAVEIVRDTSSWLHDLPSLPGESAYEDLEAIVATLRESQARAVSDVQTRLENSRRVRQRNLELRQQIANRKPRRRPAPSA